MDQNRLLLLAIWTVFLISILVGMIVVIAYFWHVTTPNEKYSLERNVIAQMREALSMTAGKMELYVNGKMRTLNISEVSWLTQDMIADASAKIA